MPVKKIILKLRPADKKGQIIYNGRKRNKQETLLIYAKKPHNNPHYNNKHDTYGYIIGQYAYKGYKDFKPFKYIEE